MKPKRYFDPFVHEHPEEVVEVLERAWDGSQNQITRNNDFGGRWDPRARIALRLAGGYRRNVAVIGTRPFDPKIDTAAAEDLTPEQMRDLSESAMYDPTLDRYYFALPTDQILQEALAELSTIVAVKGLKLPKPPAPRCVTGSRGNKGKLKANTLRPQNKTASRLDPVAVERKLKDIQKKLDALPELERKRIVYERREQELLRGYLFGDKRTGVCQICGERFPVSLLVAAHIKPRAKCTDAEKRDLKNVLPVCIMGCDALFERGFIVVEDRKVRVRMSSPANERLADLLNKIKGRTVHSWVGREKYFDWHARYWAA